MATYFFALYQWNNQKGDRQEYFTEEKTLKDFFEWVQYHRESIEKIHKTNCAVLNILKL